jgi:Glycosyltransferase like family
MISVIICSIDPDKFTQIRQHFQQLFGAEPYELIGIHDARSLSEAYNHGIAQAKGDVLIFSHDDIEFLIPQSWLVRLKRHLSHFDIVGIAGTNRLVNPKWFYAGHPYIFGQVVRPGNPQKTEFPYILTIYATPASIVGDIQAIDGLFLAVRRDVLTSVAFDEKTFDGFHCYDIDFTFCAYLAGFKLAVACDLPVIHKSGGKFDSDAWRTSAEKLMQKHGYRLPPAPPWTFPFTTIGASTKDELLNIMSAPHMPPAT